MLKNNWMHSWKKDPGETEIQKLSSEVVPDLQMAGAQEKTLYAAPVLYIPPDAAVPNRMLRCSGL